MLEIFVGALLALLIFHKGFRTQVWNLFARIGGTTASGTVNTAPFWKIAKAILLLLVALVGVWLIAIGIYAFGDTIIKNQMYLWGAVAAVAVIALLVITIVGVIKNWWPAPITAFFKEHWTWFLMATLPLVPPLMMIGPAFMRSWQFALGYSLIVILAIFWQRKSVLWWLASFLLVLSLYDMTGQQFVQNFIEWTKKDHVMPWDTAASAPAPMRVVYDPPSNRPAPQKEPPMTSSGCVFACGPSMINVPYVPVGGPFNWDGKVNYAGQNVQPPARPNGAQAATLPTPTVTYVRVSSSDSVQRVFSLAAHKCIRSKNPNVYIWHDAKNWSVPVLDEWANIGYYRQRYNWGHGGTVSPILGKPGPEAILEVADYCPLS